MRRIAVPLALVALLASAGCVYYTAPVMPPPGLFFTSIQAPIDTDMQSTPIGKKMGTASTVGVLGLFAFGDASVATAAQNGNLSRVEHLDYEYLNVLFLFQQFTVKAYGE